MNSDYRQRIALAEEIEQHYEAVQEAELRARIVQDRLTERMSERAREALEIEFLIVRGGAHYLQNKLNRLLKKQELLEVKHANQNTTS